MIKSPRVMRHGYRYEIRSTCRTDAADGPFHFFEPEEYADHMIIGDGWLVDERGNRHPGYSVAPIPMHAEALCNGKEIR